MIDVQFKWGDDGESIVLTVKGHAETADEGKDLVCASASILAYTVAQCVSDMHRNKALRKKPTVRLEKGDAVVVYKPKKAYMDEAMSIVWVAENGFSLLAANFPEAVSMKCLLGFYSFT